MNVPTAEPIPPPFALVDGCLHCADCGAAAALDGPHVLMVHEQRCGLVEELEALARSRKPVWVKWPGGISEVHSVRRGSLH